MSCTNCARPVRDQFDYILFSVYTNFRHYWLNISINQHGLDRTVANIHAEAEDAGGAAVLAELRR